MNNSKKKDQLLITVAGKSMERNYRLEKLTGEWEKKPYLTNNRKHGHERGSAFIDAHISIKTVLWLLKLSGGSVVNLHIVVTNGLKILLIHYRRYYAGEQNNIVNHGWSQCIYKMEMADDAE